MGVYARLVESRPDCESVNHKIYCLIQPVSGACASFFRVDKRIVFLSFFGRLLL